MKTDNHQKLELAMTATEYNEVTGKAILEWAQREARARGITGVVGCVSIKTPLTVNRGIAVISGAFVKVEVLPDSDDSVINQYGDVRG